MKKKERVAFITKTLDALYPDPIPPLNHKDEYTLLISVLLSARCTDARVNTITPALFAVAGNPFDMAKVPVSKIQEIIRPCGLSPQKSKAISELSKILVREHGGKVPCSFSALEQLPGVGHKTASVVMSQAFGYPAFPVDTHIHRLANRWRLSSAKSVAKIEVDLKNIFPEHSWGKVHLQMIYFGRENCSAYGCDGKRCCICSVINA